MTFTSWQDAVAAIRTRISRCDSEQRALASSLGIQIAESVPRIVAVAIVQTTIAQRFGFIPGRSSGIRLGQLAELAEEASYANPDPANADETQAWIDYFYLKRRMKALVRLRLTKGDVVHRRSHSNQFDAVASIGNDGIVYFAGGRARAWPDQLTVVAQSNDFSPRAADARRIAANRASKRSATSSWSSAKHYSLRAYSVEDNLSHDDLLDLEEVIESARDERPIQELLQNRPQLIASLVSGHSRYCIPKARLGGQYIPDFLLAKVDSGGVHWTLVELETPESPVTLASSNDFDRHTRNGLSQIRDWRNWIQDNLDQARRSPADSGLGLIDIRPQAQGLILVGRRRDLRQNAQSLRSQVAEDSRIDIHTYDWLLEQLDVVLRAGGSWAIDRSLL